MPDPITNILAIAGSTAISAFAWRVRGGAWETLLKLPPGTTKARLACSVAMTLPLAPALDLWTPAAAATLFAGMALSGWGNVMDIGRNGGKRLLEVLGMSGWGLIAVAPIVALYVYLGLAWQPLLLAGALFGPIYAFWWNLQDFPEVRNFAHGPTEWAEVSVGAALGAALMLGAML